MSGAGEYQPLVWQVATDRLGYNSLYETNEDGGPGDLIVHFLGNHEELLLNAPRLLSALVGLLSVAGTPTTDRQAEIFAEARAAIAAAAAREVQS